MCRECDALRERIADLEYEVSELRRDLGLLASSDDVERLRMALRINPGVAHVISALYNAKGRTVSQWSLLEVMPTSRDPMDRDVKIVQVRMVRARKALGADSFVTMHGTGYRMTDEGREKVAAILK